MLREDGNDDCRIFRPLGFMYRDGVGQNDFIEFRKAVQDLALVKGNQNGLILGVNVFDTPDIPIKYQLIIVVLYLHDLVVDPENAAAP